MSEQTIVEGLTKAINEAAVEKQSQGEPGWLASRRREAWSVYEKTPMPTTRLEEWRYTDLSEKLDLSSMTLSDAPEIADDPSAYPAAVREAMEADHEASGHLVMVDGHVIHTDIREDLAGKGVVLSSLKKAVETHPDLVEKWLATEAVPATEGKFPALSAALWTDGIFLYVPKGVRLDLPVRVTRWYGESGVASFSRALIVAETTSQVSYVDEILGAEMDRQSLVSTTVEVVTQDGAQVQYVAVQRMGKGAFYQSHQRTLAYRDSTLDTLNVNLGASVSRVDLNAQLLGPNANSDMLGLYFGDEDQHFDHNTSQDHVSAHANSDLLYKGALDGTSRAVFRGIIRVHPGAQQTDAYQTNRNLLLSEKARADSLPNLEIAADDVKCSHGATVGQLSEEELFYLTSRGIPMQVAERLVVMGFLGEVLSRLPLGGVVEKVTKAIDEKLHGDSLTG